MPTIHLFNPESDYALASGSPYYTPPASVVRLRREMALFPASFASEGDAVLVADNLDPDEIESSPYFPQANDRGISIIHIAELQSGVADRFDRFSPWGWNHQLLHILTAAGMPPRLLKKQPEIDRIRSLSHRRTTIPFQLSLSGLLPHIDIKPACEIKSTDDALNFLRLHPGAFFKAPWSSSGRGVICCAEMTEEQTAQWIHGIIRRQGSVMGEPGYDRILDFASEWECLDGEAEFVGLSLFRTSSRGKYTGNVTASQENIGKIISSVCQEWDSRIIDAQKEALQHLIASGYDGPAGIDMLATSSGHIVPCVEINLRQTMGMASILQHRLKENSQ